MNAPILTDLQEIIEKHLMVKWALPAHLKGTLHSTLYTVHCPLYRAILCLPKNYVFMFAFLQWNGVSWEARKVALYLRRSSVQPLRKEQSCVEGKGDAHHWTDQHGDRVWGSRVAVGWQVAEGWVMIAAMCPFSLSLPLWLYYSSLAEECTFPCKLFAKRSLHSLPHLTR